MSLGDEEIDWIKKAMIKHGLLELFKDEELAQFMSRMLRRSFSLGTRVLVQGTASDFVYLIRSGEAAVCLEKGEGEVLLAVLSEGEFFGETAVLSRFVRNANVVAKTPLVTYMIFREDFRKLLVQNKALAARFEKLSQGRSLRTEQASKSTLLSRTKNRVLGGLKTKLQGGALPMFSRMVRQSSRILVFSGAGLSMESGFSEVHGKGGTWDRHSVVSFQEFMHEEEKRKVYWRRKKEFMAVMMKAKPTLSHLALANLEKSGKLLGIITQNIDGLHQMAGNSPEKVIELNGTNREILCLSCGAREAWQETYKRLEAGIEIPVCGCGGLLKPNTISIGQDLPEEILFKALSWAKNCDLCLAVGSSLKMKAAIQIVRTVKQFGKKLILINLTPTEFDSEADVCLKASAEDVIPSALAA